MTLGNQFSAGFNGLVELQFVIDDVHGFGYGVDAGLQGDLVVQEHRLMETDVLRLDHDMRCRQTHPHEMGDECIEDIPVFEKQLMALKQE